MTEAQLTRANDPTTPRRYEAMLGERIHLGRLLGDALSHLAELTPEAVHVFSRLLVVDAELARSPRYDRDLFDVVLPAEDARLHQPPDVPSDHHWSPCSHCLRVALKLSPDVVLPPQARRPQ